MQRFYALVQAAYGRPRDPAESARLEIEWWRVHRVAQQAASGVSDELVDALARLYAFVLGVRNRLSVRRRFTAAARWRCLTSGSLRVCARIARCWPGSALFWSGRTRRCSLPSAAELETMRQGVGVSCECQQS